MIPKFRAWEKAGKRMVLVGSIDFRNEFIEYTYSPYDDSNRVVSEFLEFCDVVLMQSTGLFDCNGKEIFEGDMVAFLDDDNNPIYENAVVKFGKHTNKDTIFEREPVYIGVYVEVQKGTATFDVERMFNDYEGRFTIIGNIYENPELVEGLE